MRCSVTTLIAALPALSAAQESPLNQYKAQLQQVLSQVISYIPNPGTFDPIASEAVKNGPMKLSVLSLENWKSTLYEPVASDATTPEEWWVFITGRNKTCFGHCGKVEKAFNETAAKFADLPGAPHMALLNCDDQPILCNSWAAGTGGLWAFEMLPAPAPIEIYTRRFNLSTTTSADMVELQATGSKVTFSPLDSWFHPFNGKVTELGLSVPFGYIVWVFGLIPQWLLMLIVSMVSRGIMSKRVAANVSKQQQQQPGAAGQKKTK